MRLPKVILPLFVIFFSLTLLVSCAGPASPEGEIELKLAHWAKEDADPRFQGTKKFVDLVNEKGAGKVHITFYPAGSLYKVKDLVPALVEGAVDMGTQLDCYMEGICPLVSWPQIPGAVSFDTYNEVMDEAEPYLDEALREKGLKLIGPTPHLSWECIANRDGYVKTMDDMKPLKMRSAMGAVGEFFRILDVGVVSLPASEAYVSIQQGVADGTWSTQSMVYSYKIFEVAPYLTRTMPKGVGCGVTYYILMNPDKWDSLPKDVQELLMSCGKEARDWTLEYDKEYTINVWADLEAVAKQPVYELSAAEQEEWWSYLAPRTWDWAIENDARAEKCKEICIKYGAKYIK